MTTTFFTFDSYQEFLRARYEHLRQLKPQFSSRFFARRAGIKSHVYFRLVVEGQRKLSVDYAERFARGLDLSAFETECLVTRVGLDNADDQRTRRTLMTRLDRLRRRAAAAAAATMPPDHVRILSDLVTLRLYLLAQSRQFRLEPRWLAKHMAGAAANGEIAKRVELLLASGLWVKEGDRVRTIAPSVRTGDGLAELDLLRTHAAMLALLQRRLENAPAAERLAGARSFLFDRRRLPEAQKRIEEFRQQLEIEFEDLNATEVFTAHIGFFAL